MAKAGIPQKEIAACIGIADKTLAKHYDDELIHAEDQNAKVQRTLFSMATDLTHPKCATAAIFWMKARAGWKETSVHEVNDAREQCKRDFEAWMGSPSEN